MSPRNDITQNDLKLVTEDEKKNFAPHLLEIISYRKSGLSLNHIIGCSLDCAYCVRHFFDNFDMKIPEMICTDDEALAALLNDKFFIQHVTPLQLFNRATDPFLSGVKPHTHYLLRELDRHGLTNIILVITRAKVTEEDMEALERLKSIKVSLFFTYSGITDSRIEPIAPSEITVRSIDIASRFRKRTKVILYWRPIVPGWNDDDATMRRVLEIGSLVDAIVFTGYYHRPENTHYLKQLGVQIPYEEFHRRKVLPLELDQKVVRLYLESGIKTPLFRKTSCGATCAHELPDYNGHWGVREICDICPLEQQQRCAAAHETPSILKFEGLLKQYGYGTDYLIEDGHIWTEGLGEERRYHLQHTLGFQIWDIDWPHLKLRHGRSPIGYSLSEEETEWYSMMKKRFQHEAVYSDD